MKVPRGFKVAMAGALALQSLAVRAQDGSVTLEPINQWETQRLDDRCVTRRAFGDAAKPTVLELSQIDPWDGGFHTAVTSAQFAPTRTPFRASWLPGGRESLADLPTYAQDAAGREWIEFPHGLWDGKLDALGGAELTAYFKEDGPKRFQREVEAFQIVGAFDKTVVLQTGSMEGVVAAARQCMEQMLAAQGVDPRDMTRDESRAVAKHLPSQQRIWNRLPDVIKTRTRPSLVDFLLYIDATGHPTSCRLSSLPVDRDFEAWGCDLFMKNASFEFALGQQARPTFFKSSLLYRPR